MSSRAALLKVTVGLTSWLRSMIALSKCEKIVLEGCTKKINVCLLC
jgi:hypothetical protein